MSPPRRTPILMAAAGATLIPLVLAGGPGGGGPNTRPGSRAPATAARVVCEEGGVRVEAPLVRPDREGVHLVFENPAGAWGFELHPESWPPGSAMGNGLPGAKTVFTVPPGQVTVACLAGPRGATSIPRRMQRPSP